MRIAIEDPLTKCVSRLVNGKCPSPTLLAVLEKEWFTAGQALPFESETDPTSPTFLRAYVVKPETAEPPPQERQLNFKTGLAYGVDREARLMRRHVERQAAKLAAISTETELMEEALPQEPPAHIADAVEAARADYAADVARQAAQAEFIAKRNDEADAWLKQTELSDKP